VALISLTLESVTPGSDVKPLRGYETRNFKKRERGTPFVPRSRFGLRFPPFVLMDLIESATSHPARWHCVSQVQIA